MMEKNKSKQKRYLIAIKIDTREKLKKLGNLGDTYSSAIGRMADFCTENKDLYEKYVEEKEK